MLKPVPRVSDERSLAARKDNFRELIGLRVQGLIDVLVGPGVATRPHSVHNETRRC